MMMQWHLSLAGRSLCLLLILIFEPFPNVFAGPVTLVLPPLPYSYNALEPIISENIMKLHHLKHHQTYTTKTNEAFAKLYSPEYGLKNLTKLGIDRMLENLAAIPESLRNTIRNNGGGYVNHDMFWKVMKAPREITPPADQDGDSGSGAGPVTPRAREFEIPSPSPSSPFENALRQSFGSFKEFQAKFTQEALGLFGSGWVWLYVDGVNGSLVLSSTSNQDNPIMAGKSHKPVFCLDVWEHAYYLDYQNRRDEYVKKFWHVVNWPYVESLYDNAIKSNPSMKTEL